MDKKLLVGVSVLALGLSACGTKQPESFVKSPYIKLICAMQHALQDAHGKPVLVRTTSSDNLLMQYNYLCAHYKVKDLVLSAARCALH